MTISKKLPIALALTLGIQFSAGAFFNDTHNQKSLILTFAQDLRRQNSIQAQRVATWLDNHALSNSNQNLYIIDVINNYNLTEQSRLMLLSQMMQKEKTNNRKDAARQFVSDICAFTLAAGTCALFVWAIIEDIKNPRPVIYRAPKHKPSVTVTWRREYPKYPNDAWWPYFSYTSNWPW